MSTYHSKAFVYHGPGKVACEDIKFQCGPRDIMLKIRASARCGTDNTIFRKGHTKVTPPQILGHELSAEIVEIGPRVKTLCKGIGYKDGCRIRLNFKVGDRVTAQSRIARYRDGLLLINRPITILSFIIPGGYSQYMKIPPELYCSGSLIKLPRNVSDEDAALIEPAACALESIFSTPHPVGVDRDGRHLFHAGIRKNGNVCIIGSGTLSLIYALLCRLEGAGKIWIMVRSQKKAAFIKKALGNCVRTLVAEDYSGLPLPEKLMVEEKLAARLKEETDGELFDDVVSACPSADAQRLMLRLYTMEGYAVGACFGGTHELVDAADLDQNHYRNGKTIGTSGCSTRGMETVARWLGEGKLTFHGLANPRHFTFRDNPEEFFTIPGLKPILYPWE